MKRVKVDNFELQHLCDQMLITLSDNPNESGFNNAFGDLRTFLRLGNKSQQWHYWANKTFRTAVQINENVYQDIWLDYIYSFKHLWDNVLFIYTPFVLDCLAELEVAVKAIPFQVHCLELIAESSKKIETRTLKEQIQTLLSTELLSSVAFLTINNYKFSFDNIIELFTTPKSSNLRVAILGRRYSKQISDKMGSEFMNTDFVPYICNSDYLGQLRMLILPINDDGVQMIVESDKLHLDVKDYYLEPQNFRPLKVFESLGIPPIVRRSTRDRSSTG